MLWLVVVVTVFHLYCKTCLCVGFTCSRKYAYMPLEERRNRADQRRLLGIIVLIDGSGVDLVELFKVYKAVSYTHLTLPTIYSV